MFEFPIHHFSDRAMIALFGLFLALLLGGPGWLHRFLWLDKPAKLARYFVVRLGEKLNRRHRSAGSLRVRGVMYVLFISGFCLLIGGFFGRLAMSLPELVIVEIILVAYLLPVRALVEQNTALASALKAKDFNKAQGLMAKGKRYDAPSEDLHQLARAGIELQALDFAQRIVAPLLAYLALGLPAMLWVMALHIMDRHAGSREAHFKAFGALFVRLNGMVQWIPSRFAAFLLAFAALVAPGCHMLRALRGMIQGSFRMISSNSGAVIGAVAGALQLSLAGKRRRLEEIVDDEWIDFGSAKASILHLHRMNILYLVSVMLCVLLATLLNLALA